MTSEYDQKRQWYLNNKDKHRESMRKYIEANRDAINAKQRERMERNKNQYFESKSCARCGSKDNLELDHIDPSIKVTHRIWSMGEEKRNAELLKCQVLCHGCHLVKSKEDGDLSNPGESNGNSKLTEKDVLEIRDLVGVMKYRDIAPLYGITFALVGYIARRKVWKHI